LQEQERVIIGEISVPVIREDDVIYYPISFVMEKVLLKKTGQKGLQKESQYIKNFKIDYGWDTGGTQNVNCISEEGLRRALNNSKIGRLSVEQRKAMNVLLDYLHMDLISEDDRFLNKVSEEMLNKWKYNEYIMDCIKYVLDNEPDIVWQKCTKCGNYYPYHTNFFKENLHSGKDYPLYTVCRNCSCTNTRGKDDIKHSNNDLRLVYNKYGEDIYILHRDHKVLEIYNHWIDNYTKYIPKVINNEEDKLFIIRHLWNEGKFSKYDDITGKAIQEVCKFWISGNNIIKRINQELYGVVFRGGEEYITSIEDAKEVFSNYIYKHNIIIDNIYDYDYMQLLKNAKLRGFMTRYRNNLLGFVMELYDNEYPAYKFKIYSGDKYWGIKNNRIRALKYFIEEDMRIPIEKVPLYITLTALRKNGTATMYNVCKKYYNSLFEWINEVYPERFDPKDFDIHYVRNDFDSIEEAEVHDILKKKFKNKVIYNPNNTERTIKIDGKVPDWLLFTNNKCYILEYFGLDMERNTSHNSRIEDYKERTENKIEKYDKLDGYGKVYIFPDDLKDGFKGLMDKLELIV